MARDAGRTQDESRNRCGRMDLLVMFVKMFLELLGCNRSPYTISMILRKDRWGRRGTKGRWS